MKLKILFLLSMLSCINANAQDVDFFQFQYAPVQLSPTYAGTSFGPRFNLNYQLADLGIASFDVPFKLENGDIVGIGNKFIFEKLSRKNKFIRNGFNINYQKKIFNKSSNEHYIIYGVETALGLIRTKNQNSNSSKKTISWAYFGDLSTGIAWQSKFKNNFSFHIGATYFHVNKPLIKSSRFNFFTRVKKKFMLHGLFDIPIGKRLMINPKFQYSTQEFSFLLTRGNDILLINSVDIKYSFDKNIQSYFYLGLGVVLNSETNISSLESNPAGFKMGYQNKKFGIHLLQGVPRLKFWEEFFIYEISLNYTLSKKINHEKSIFNNSIN